MSSKTIRAGTDLRPPDGKSDTRSAVNEFENYFTNYTDDGLLYMPQGLL